jgi:hypothetical protein
VKRPVHPLVAAVAALALLAGCASSGRGPATPASLAPSATEYEKLGINPSRVEPWEDGFRTDGGPGTYEWWYFDFNLDDGSTLVIDYLDKNPTSPGTGLEPFTTLSLDTPGQQTVSRTVTARAADFASSRERCDVRVGPCSVSGDLHEYTLHFQSPDVRADLTLRGSVPPWRPGTGVSFFSPEKYFAWLPSVPQGTVGGTLVVQGRSITVSGVGYHDHNWGNASLVDLVHHWYWGRAQVGPYTVIASWITATPAYGSGEIPVFMLARDGAIVAEDGTRVRFSALDLETDPYTKKPAAGTLVYNYADGEVAYRVTFQRQTDLVRTRLADTLPWAQALLSRLAGFDGAYLRFGGTITLERFEAGALVESVSQQSGVWELMYFGHAPAR